MSDSWRIRWDGGEAQVQPLGAMLGPVHFEAADGRRIQPFFVAPWAGEPGAEELPGLLRRLRGEWPCVPFGAERTPASTEWRGSAPAIGDGALHGFGANNAWELVEHGADRIEVAIDYPPSHPVRRLRRRIAGREGFAALDLELEVEVDRAVDLGLALHPTFRLPEAPGGARVEIAGVSAGLSFPEPVDDSTRALPGAWFERIDQVPGRDGTRLDFSSLPLAEPSEDLLQIVAGAGHARIVNLEERWAARIDYDPALFPSIILWSANRGWQDFPWAGRTRCLGLEPARAAFDLGQPVCADPNNPIARRGVPTSIALGAGEILRTSYSILVESLS